MIKRTRRAVVAGVALSLGLAAPASAIFIGTGTGTGVKVDPGAPSATLNVAGVSNDLAPTATFGLNAVNAVNPLGILNLLNAVVVNDALVANAIVTPKFNAAMGLAGDVTAGGLGIAGGLASDAGDYLNLNSAEAIISAVGLF